LEDVEYNLLFVNIYGKTKENNEMSLREPTCGFRFQTGNSQITAPSAATFWRRHSRTRSTSMQVPRKQIIIVFVVFRLEQKKNYTTR